MLCGSDKSDWIHESLELKEVGIDQYGVFAKEFIPSGTLILYSPVRLASPMRCTARDMANTLLSEAILEERPKLKLLFEKLWPRNVPLNMSALTAKIATNAFSGLENMSFVLLDNGSLFNHSCAPNASQFWRPDKDAPCFCTLRDIAAGEEVTISYDGVTPIDWKASRQARLEDLAFTCNCSCCLGDINPSSLVARSLTKHCWYCGDADKPKYCTRCNMAAYCSTECQRQNWNQHSLICQRLKKEPVFSLIDRNGPSRNHLWDDIQKK